MASVSRKKSIIGREKEMAILKACYKAPEAQFVALYGRRRVGKTYLIKQSFHERFTFYMSGVYGMSMKEHLRLFADQMSVYFGAKIARPKNWMDAFRVLREALSRSKKKCWVVFLDELPWLDTPKSGFLRALEAFWNMWGSDQPQLKLFVCGSATTWMVNKLIGDKGGLHNRLTRRIHLHPFTLSETEQYLRYKGIRWDRGQILQCYMAMGGTPFYLSLLDKDESCMQNIDRLFFAPGAELREEYDFLFRSLFKDAPAYKRIVELLAQKLKGFTRKELMRQLHLADNGKLSEQLDNLVRCDFVQAYAGYGKKQRETMYQLGDLYSLFYIRFVKDYKGRNPHAWSEMKDQIRSSWQGYAFEQVAMHHVEQIKAALGISGIASDLSSWSCVADEDGKGAQIDMVISRADRVINLCEVKFSVNAYELKADYVQHILERRERFREQTQTRDTLHLTFITTLGLKHNKYYGYVNNVIALSDLFK